MEPSIFFNFQKLIKIFAHYNKKFNGKESI